MKTSTCFAAGALCLTLCAGAQAAAATVPAVRPVRPALEVTPAFDFDKKTRRSVSGIACTPDAARLLCLVVFDEGTKAQFAMLGAARLDPIGKPIELADGASKGKSRGTGELDAEGAAVAAGFHYVIGSHSVKRRSCKSNPTSHSVVRFRVGSMSGSPPQTAVTELVRTTRLWDLMQQDPYLQLHMQGCLGDGAGGTPAQMQSRPGINIEGIAVTGGRLYAGFRGPSEDGSVPVFSVDAQALFEGGEAHPRLDRLPVGTRIGIRDMAAAHHSILLLLGPDDHEAGVEGVWAVAQWTPGTTAPPRVLASLDIRREDLGGACFEAIKPEAIAILEESAAKFRVVVLSDGVCDGGPLIFDLPRAQ